MTESKKLEILIGLFLLGGIIVWLIIPTSFQDTTIILESGDGGVPISCLPSGGFVLAQNLTDLCDVTIDNPITSQIIEYNGSQWINVNHTDTITSITSSSNSTIGVVPTSGNVVLYPKYELLCQTTLTSANATVSCNNFEVMRYLHVQIFTRSNGGTGIEPALRFNGDTGNNYAFRISTNGGADVTTTSTSRCNLFTTSGTLMASGNGQILDINIYNNLASERKIYDGIGASGLNSSVATAPNKNEVSCKWDNTTAQITSITLIAFSGTGNFNTDSQLTVWGYN